jgi:phosphatidylglycerol:prolipoprotein diacylglycerol transferase
VGILATPLVAYLIIQSELPEKYRKPLAAAGVVGVWIAVLIYRQEVMPVHAYGVMLAVAALVGITIGVARAPMVGFKKTEIVDFGLYVVLWGVIGARVFHVFERHELYFTGGRGILNALAVWNGGLVFYGGLIGGMSYVVYYAWKHGDGVGTLLRIFDLGAPCVLFGLAFGRVGCFLNGCCFGRPTGLPWGIAYRTGTWRGGELLKDSASHICSAIYTAGSRSSQWRHLMQELPVPEESSLVTYHVHPSQVYASVSSILIGILLSVVFYRKPRPGFVTALFMLTYPVNRFVLEGWFRGDTPAAAPSLSTLTISQYVSLVGFAAGVVWMSALVYLHIKEKRAAAEKPA